MLPKGDAGRVAFSTHLLGSDTIGSMRLKTDGTTGGVGAEGTYTAFGEFISSDRDRYGYAGGWGYESDSAVQMPFLHVGHRYYDRSTGHFLQ